MRSKGMECIYKYFLLVFIGVFTDVACHAQYPIMDNLEREYVVKMKRCDCKCLPVIRAEYGVNKKPARVLHLTGEPGLTLRFSLQMYNEMKGTTKCIFRLYKFTTCEGLISTDEALNNIYGDNQKSLFHQVVCEKHEYVTVTQTTSTNNGGVTGVDKKQSWLQCKKCGKTVGVFKIIL